MKAESPPHPASVNVLLADYLRSEKETIISEWLKRVRGDTAIKPTESLNTAALKNHLPEVFDDLTETLRLYGSQPVAQQSLKDAEEHGATRMHQGYELPEMLHELKHLRAILIYHLCLFEGMNPDFGMASRQFIATTMHGFLDAMAIDATEEYLWSQLSLEERNFGGRIRW